MVKRLLNALEYPQADSVNINDENSFRTLIVWLEENKIKKCNPNLIQTLKTINSNNWVNCYNKYREELGCPPLNSKQEELQWLLGYAVQTETHNKKDVYIKHAVENLKITSAPSVVAENPLDKLDFHSEEFADGVNNIAKILKIASHPDHLVTLKAIQKVIVERMSTQCLEKPEDYIIKGNPFPFQDADLGFDLNDPVLNQAAKILRMLYIHDLRDLQTKANELIVAVQTVTADPKTDTKLGKVGR